MKLTDKRFWKFEVMMLLCGFMLLCQIVVMLICNGAEIEACGGLILLLPALCIYFAISGIPAWLLYKGYSWLRLAGWLYLFSVVLLIGMLLITRVRDNTRPNGWSANGHRLSGDPTGRLIV